MSYKFNPFTGNLDFYEISGGLQIVSFFRKDKQIVDAAFLIDPDITLLAEPLGDSETVFLNGLEIDNSNYAIVLNVLTMVITQLKIGDTIDINYKG